MYDSIIDSFKAAWLSGERPKILSYLPDTQPDRDKVLVQLVLLDWKFRVKSGEAPAAEDYRKDFPEINLLLPELESGIDSKPRRRRKGEDSWRASHDSIPDLMEFTLGGGPTDNQAHEVSYVGSVEPVPDPRVVVSPQSAQTPVEVDVVKDGGTIDDNDETIHQVGSVKVGRPNRDQSKDQLTTRRALGNYVLLEKIGAGGMGQVYKARHARMDRIVAIKLLPATLAADPVSIARFEREVKAAAKLTHTNIVAALDADCANGEHLLVMEYIDGRDLSIIVKKEGVLSVQKAVACIIQAARGLEAAHRMGVIHRDIKPSNLLLDKEGTVKILDMGLARVQSDMAGRAELTSTGMVMGTVDYMAPEQADDPKKTDARSDIYSLGCTLYYLMTGRAIYGGETYMQRMWAHREKQIPSLRTINPDVSPELDAIFAKMVAKRPADRFQSAAKLLQALEGFTPNISNADFPTITPQPVEKPVGVPDFDDTEVTHISKTNPSAAVVRHRPLLKGHQPPLNVIAPFLAGLILLAAVFFSLRTRDGTLLVTVNPPDATVLVSDKDGKFEIIKKGVKGKISFHVDPGTHHIKIEKEGYALFGREIELDAGERKSLDVKLVPLGNGDPLIAKKRQLLAFELPGFAEWEARVRAMQPEDQIEAVRKKLMDLNPGFDGDVTRISPDHPPIETIVNGAVTNLRFSTDRVKDLSPVRCLDSLKILVCQGTSPEQGSLSDLSPIDEMHLTEVGLDSNAKLSDIAALKNMKLTHLNINWTAVSDISFLKGMPLVEVSCSHSKVTDLMPLAEMSLVHLEFTPGEIRSGLAAIRRSSSLRELGTSWDELLDPSEFWKRYDAGEYGHPEMPDLEVQMNSPEFQQWLKVAQELPAAEQIEAVRKKLIELNPGFDGRIAGSREDSVPPLVEHGDVVAIYISSENVANLLPVRAFMELRELGSLSKQNSGQIRDLLPLTGMRIRRLDCSGNPNLDIINLKKVSLTSLRCINCGLTSLDPVRGQRLLRLVITGNQQIVSLVPLSGMSLSEIWCDKTQVSDLSPLTGMPLQKLNCSLSNVADLSPLHGMSLEQLQIEQTPIEDLAPLAGMKLKKLTFTPRPSLKGVDVIRQLESLVEIGTSSNSVWSAAEFWQKYDAGEFSPQ